MNFSPIRAGFLWRAYAGHLLFCLFFYELRQVLDSRSAVDWARYTSVEDWALTFAGYSILFLYALLPYLILRRTHGLPPLLIAGALLVGGLFSVGFRHLLENVLAPDLIGWRNYPSGTPFSAILLDNVYYLLLHGGTGVIVFLLQLTRHRERDRQRLMVENQRTELAFLRSQINPHFLFNTLNNIYSLVFRGSELGLRSIERLTRLLRYGLYEKGETVPLGKEIEHLINFIELEKMRYDFPLQLVLDLPGLDKTGDESSSGLQSSEYRPGQPTSETDPTSGVSRLLVPPLLLIAFVENAFKHGDPHRPLEILLTVDGKALHYRVHNFRRSAHKDRIGGIGLENLKRRLALLYGDRHALQLVATEADFTADLKIQLP